jgi:hypothetical protein
MLQSALNMDPAKLRSKLDGILEAIAAGHTCEQILTADHTLSYHDIFHAVAEAPTGYWRRAAATGLSARPPEAPAPLPATIRHRSD